MKKLRRLAEFSILFESQSQLVVVDERQESHVTGILDGLCQHTLVACAGSGGGPGRNLSVWRDELLQELCILVIDVLDVVLGEVADLLTGKSLFCKHDSASFP